MRSRNCIRRTEVTASERDSQNVAAVVNKKRNWQPWSTKECLGKRLETQIAEGQLWRDCRGTSTEKLPRDNYGETRRKGKGMSDSAKGDSTRRRYAGGHAALRRGAVCSSRAVPFTPALLAAVQRRARPRQRLQ
eukprot:6185213-Pleurochrysis_carterae.AAC.2